MESKTYSQKVDEWLFSKSGCHIIDFCRKFGYYPLAIKIMALDENDEKKSKAIMAKDEELKAHYIKCSKDPHSIARKGNNRSWTHYFKDLITGWVVEDLVMEMLKEQGIEIEHNGHDAQRKIAIGKDVSQKADFMVRVGNVVRNVELTSEFNRLLEKNGFIEKRAPALINIWKSKGIWIYRDLVRGKYVLIDFATEKVKLHLRRHNNVIADWSKDVHRYVLDENGKKVRDDKLLAAEIISVVGCSIDGKEQHNLEEVIDSDSPPKDYGIGGTVQGKNREVKSEVKPNVVVAPKKKEVVKPQNDDSNKAKKIVKQAKPQLQPPSPPSQQEAEEEMTADYDYGDGDFV